MLKSLTPSAEILAHVRKSGGETEQSARWHHRTMQWGCWSGRHDIWVRSGWYGSACWSGELPWKKCADGLLCLCVNCPMRAFRIVTFLLAGFLLFVWHQVFVSSNRELHHEQGSKKYSFIPTSYREWIGTVFTGFIIPYRILWRVKKDIKTQEWQDDGSCFRK